MPRSNNQPDQRGKTPARMVATLNKIKPKPKVKPNKGTTKVGGAVV